MSVDPYVVQIPEVLVNRDGTLTSQAKAWFEYDNRWKHDLWQQSGGGIDLFTDFEGRINDNHHSSKLAFHHAAKANRIAKYVTRSSNWTTAGYQFVDATATLTVTLETRPPDETRVLVRHDGSTTDQVTITDGTGTVILLVPGTVQGFVYYGSAGWILS